MFKQRFPTEKEMPERGMVTISRLVLNCVSIMTNEWRVGSDRCVRSVCCKVPTSVNGRLLKSHKFGQVMRFVFMGAHYNNRTPKLYDVLCV